MEKRVLIFSTAYFPLVGGAEVAMRELTDRLPGWQFDLVCAKIRPGLAKKEKIGNVTVHRCGIGHPVDKFLLPCIGAWRALRISESRDIRIIWSLMASFGGFAALGYTWLRPSVRMLLTLQEGDPLEHYAHQVGRLAWLHRRIFRRADTLHAISAFLAAWGKKMGFCGEPEIIPNGVDIRAFAARISPERRHALRQSWGAADTDVVLVTTSRLSLKNGVDDAIRALEFLPSYYRLIIAGDGEDREKLYTLASEKGLSERVVFLGQVEHTSLPELLCASDIFVRASLSEGLGISFLEAMAAGIPLIGTPVGGIPDFLIDGRTGVFCEPRNPASIARAAERIQAEAGLRETLVANGKALVRQRYDWDVIARTVERSLELLLTEGKHV